ncbi:MAG TPA: hemolysin family protein [Pyrinomonadaceae bacterium]|nr:hemolysin family protein [Pyrinomonadaceae bacterium]
MLTAGSLLLILFLVLLNGFFVASEFALVGVRRSRIQTLAANGNRAARRLLGLLDDLNAYISATQLGITMASLALGWIGEPVFARLLEEPLKGRVSEVALHTISFTIAFTIITFLHIVLGELAPKTMALERAERVALAIAWPLHTFYKIFSWPIRLLDWAGTRTVRLFGLEPSTDHASVYTEEELRHLVDVSRRSGHVEAEEQQLINRVFEFTDAEVREAMVPRTQVEALPVGATFDEARAAFRASGYSRLPVYRGRLDEVVGLLFRKDLDMGQVPPDKFELEEHVRPPVFIPATATLGSALTQMQASRTHFVFVIDEHGGVEGILTLEDLLEEIVGEINDEFDEEVREQITRERGTYLLDGMLAVRDANQYLKLGLPEDEGYTTIAGFLMARAGRVLGAGDTVEHDAGTFKVEGVDGRRIRRVRFTPAKAAKSEEQPPRVSVAALLPLVCAPLMLVA